MASRPLAVRADDGAWLIPNVRNSNLFLEPVQRIRDDRAPEVDRANGFFKVGFQVPDVREVADAVEHVIGERPRALGFPAFGVRIIQIHAPDGNTIRLASPLDTVERGNGG